MKPSLVAIFVCGYSVNSQNAEPYNECWNENEKFTNCGSPCQPKCGRPLEPFCAEVCVSGCFCAEGFIRNHRGECITMDECEINIEKSQCFQELAEATAEMNGEEMMVGGFVPSCDDNGVYSSKQCHGSTGFCWCAERDGTEIENTATRDELDCPRHKICSEKHDEDVKFLNDAQGMIADFYPFSCQEDNPALWVEKVNDPMMFECMCLDPKTGKAVKYEHPCSEPCSEITPFSPIRNGAVQATDFFQLLMNFIIKLLTTILAL